MNSIFLSSQFVLSKQVELIALGVVRDDVYGQEAAVVWTDACAGSGVMHCH